MFALAVFITIVVFLKTVKKNNAASVFITKQFDRIVSKGKNLSAEISNDAENWKSNLLQIFDAFSESADKLKSTADQIANGMDAVENDGEKMIAQLKNLQQSAPTSDALQLRKKLQCKQQVDNLLK